ncbi:hypothetical protein [Streptomyces alkaliterrae]|uniref:Uncharacterized protein n=1 Tax=Streptomyces alkaliterrae TaxID=2213162 RepID=A0A5P0YWR9_9ACTN|nr:hypothetical protein [Streptomyces alkaliterrae]MBB1252175.1 hypothetical protein [Streptomyces alkaliterrae]MBB1258570.1 hypothetical protein [Streptomyces alkaliterrae]MQS02939.1 hypothetical protein [Streptomyces alkaliterrae]
MKAGGEGERAAEAAGDMLPVRADGHEDERTGSASRPKRSRAARREPRRVRGVPGEERPVHTIRVRRLFG